MGKATWLWSSSSLFFALGFSTLIWPVGNGAGLIVNLFGNLEIDLAAALAFVGVHSFLGCARSALWPLIPAAALSLGKVALFELRGMDLPANVIMGCLDRAIVSSASAWLLLRRAEADLRPASWAAAGFHLMWTAILMARIASEVLLVIPNGLVTGESLHEPTTAPALCIRVCVTFSLTLSYLWMVGRRLETRLTRLATVDPLTGVANRRLVWEKGQRLVARASQRGEPMAVLMIDIDHFKAVNDKWGHATGDVLLVKVAETICGAIRATDIAGRLGGEEFAVLLPESERSTTNTIAERIRTAIEAIEMESTPDLKCTVSIGWADLIPGADWEKLIDSADQALYQSKRAGRNRVTAYSQ
jgi:diguanylate cyclase (GGDEF)-like protein